MLAELERLDADVLAVQEMDQFEEFWAPWLERRGYGETFMLVNLMLCSLLGSITVLCSAAISNFIDNFFNLIEWRSTSWLTKIIS